MIFPAFYLDLMVIHWHQMTTWLPELILFKFLFTFLFFFFFKAYRSILPILCLTVKNSHTVIPTSDLIEKYWKRLLFPWQQNKFRDRELLLPKKKITNSHWRKPSLPSFHYFCLSPTCK